MSDSWYFLNYKINIKPTKNTFGQLSEYSVSISNNDVENVVSFHTEAIGLFEEILYEIVNIYDFKEKHDNHKKQFIDSKILGEKHYTDMIKKSMLLKKSLPNDWVDSIRVYLKMIE